MNIKSSNFFYARFWYISGGLVAGGYLIRTGKPVLCPLLISLLLSMLLLPVAHFFEKRFHCSRMLAACLSVFLMAGLLTSIIWLLISRVSDIKNDLPVFKQQMEIIFSQLQKWSLAKFNINIAQQVNHPGDVITRMLRPDLIGNTLLSVSSVLLFFVFIVFDTIFLLFYRHLLLSFLVSLLKKENSALIYSVANEVQYVTRRYLTGLLLEMVVVTCASVFSFWIIGLKYPLLMGLITGLFNIIPYAGIFTALLINVLIGLSTASPGMVIGIIIIIVVIHLTDSNILLPFIVGSRVRLNALITILGLAIGAMIWQIPGMFLSIPVIAIFKIIFDRVNGLKPLGLLLGEEKGREIRSKNQTRSAIAQNPATKK